MADHCDRCGKDKKTKTVTVSGPEDADGNATGAWVGDLCTTCAAEVGATTHKG